MANASRSRADDRERTASILLAPYVPRHTFAAVGTGPGREELERRIADIARERGVPYAR